MGASQLCPEACAPRVNLSPYILTLIMITQKYLLLFFINQLQIEIFAATVCHQQLFPGARQGTAFVLSSLLGVGPLKAKGQGQGRGVWASGGEGEGV